MQETGGDMGYQQSRKFYHTYVEQSVIGGIIMSYLTTSHCKVGSKKIAMHLELNFINIKIET